MKRRKWLYPMFILTGLVLMIFLFFCSENWRVLHSTHLRRHYLNHWNQTDPPRYDLEYSAQLEHMVEDYDFCAVVTVTKGMEASLGRTMVQEYRDRFGEETEEMLTEEQVSRLLAEEPHQIWRADWSKLELKVDEYIYDKTGSHKEQLVLTEIAEITGFTGNTIYAYSEERLLIFGNVRGDGCCEAGTAWAYILTDKNYLVPMNDFINREMASYGARKASILIRDIKQEVRIRQDNWELDEARYRRFEERYSGQSFQTEEPIMIDCRWDGGIRETIADWMDFYQTTDEEERDSWSLRNKYLWTLNDGDSWMSVDGHYTLAERISQYDADACVLVEVTKGLEDSLEDAGLLQKEPWRIWDAELADIEMKAVEYIYDRTGAYQEELLLRKGSVDPFMLGNARQMIYAHTGERIVLFLWFDERMNGYCQGVDYLGIYRNGRGSTGAVDGSIHAGDE